MHSDLESRVARLEDIRAIETLKWRYLRACDRKQPELVRACFMPDAVIDYEGFERFEDRDSFVDTYIRFGCQPHIVDMHHGQNPIVELTGADSAIGHFDLFFHQMDLESGRYMQFAVAYDDAFVKRDGQWLICKTVARQLSTLIQQRTPDGQLQIVTAGPGGALTSPLYD